MFQLFLEISTSQDLGWLRYQGLGGIFGGQSGTEADFPQHLDFPANYHSIDCSALIIVIVSSGSGTTAIQLLTPLPHPSPTLVKMTPIQESQCTCMKGLTLTIHCGDTLSICAETVTKISVCIEYACCNNSGAVYKASRDKCCKKWSAFAPPSSDLTGSDDY